MIDSIWTDPVRCPEHGVAMWRDSLGTLVCMQGGIDCMTWDGVQPAPGQKVVAHRANGVLYAVPEDTYTGSST